MEALRLIEAAAAAIKPPSERARAAARTRHRRLTKPAGSLGRIEELHAWAAGVYRTATPRISRRFVVVAAGDHGVTAEGVSAYPADVTWQMVRNMAAGGAAINALAAQARSQVIVVDAGVARAVEHEGVRRCGVRAGAGNIAREPAMTQDEAAELVARGIALATEVAEGQPTAIALGDMGIGNTTAAAALTSALTGAPARATAGRGTGIDDDALARKIDAIERALALHRPRMDDGLDALAKAGGCEIAFLAGVAIGGAAAGAAVLLDGYPTTAAALAARAIAPACEEYLLASHQSAEPGHAIALEHLGLRPLLDLGLRLGEGTGAALAMMLLEAALRVPREMATFDDAGVARATAETPPEA